jgi:hypothetical protein
VVFDHLAVAQADKEVSLISRRAGSIACAGSTTVAADHE